MSDFPGQILKLMAAQVPFNRLLGIQGESASAGACVLVLPVRAEFVGDFRRPALHGGVVSALIDTAGGVAAWSTLGPDESVSTVDLTVDFLEPSGLAAPLRDVAQLVRQRHRECHVRVGVNHNRMLRGGDHVVQYI